MTLVPPDDQVQALRRIVSGALEALTQKHQARERGLQLMREVIRCSALTIRAIHRNEYDEARRLLAQAREKLQEAMATLREHPDVYQAGFLQDAQKEYAEACLTLAFITSGPVPGPQDLGVELAPYLNGLAEAASELRRYILDALRRDAPERTEALLDLMDEVYSLLVTVDFPDAVTGGLRRTTDMVRGVLERTRGDLTMALRQRELARQLQDVARAQGAAQRPWEVPEVPTTSQQE